MRETIQGLMSESMILYYLHAAKDSFWPQEEMPANNEPKEKDISDSANEEKVPEDSKSNIRTPEEILSTRFVFSHIF